MEQLSWASSYLCHAQFKHASIGKSPALWITNCFAIHRGPVVVQTGLQSALKSGAHSVRVNHQHFPVPQLHS